MDKLELQFVHQEILKGIRDIFSAQRYVAQSRIYQVGRERRTTQGTGNTVRGRSGLLMASLKNPHYLVERDGAGWRAETRLPSYIRFLDMKRHGNYQIYNRQVWGILYKETLMNVKYGFREWLGANFPECLKQFNNLPK